MTVTPSDRMITLRISPVFAPRLAAALRGEAKMMSNSSMAHHFRWLADQIDAQLKRPKRA